MYTWEYFGKNVGSWETTPLFTSVKRNMSLDELIKEAKFCWGKNGFPQRILDENGTVIYKIGNEKELDKMRDQGNMRVHYFRETGLNHNGGHNECVGVHGKDPRYCRACVSVMVAIIEKDADSCYVGISFRNPFDHMNRKIGRAMAIGKAKKNERLDIRMPLAYIKQLIDASYNDGLHRRNVRYFWKNVRNDMDSGKVQNP